MDVWNKRLKARLAAQGYTQVSVIDFDETFKPVVKPTTIRIVLSIVVINKWFIWQLDFKNAFLMDFLKKQFKAQPRGFTNPQFSNHVCHIKSALYVLKQAHRVWNDLLSLYLLGLGFFVLKQIHHYLFSNLHVELY